jgi:hypothetical protein
MNLFKINTFSKNALLLISLMNFSKAGKIDLVKDCFAIPKTNLNPPLEDAL